MSTPTVGELHVDRYLTGFSLAFTQDESMFVSGAAASVVPVLKASDKYLIYNRGDFWRDEAAPRPLGGKPVQVEFTTTSDTYVAEEFALEATLDDRQTSNADEPLQLEEASIRMLTEKHMIKRDRVWATNFFKAGVWTVDQTGVAAAPSTNEFLQFDVTGSDPIGLIARMQDAITVLTAKRPNVIVMGADVFTTLRSHAQIQDVIKYTQRGIATPELLASLFEVDRIVIPRSIYNSAAEGAADVFSFIVDTKAMWMGYIDPSPTVNSQTAISIFAWTGLIPGATNAIGGVIERGRDNRAHSDFFQMRMAWDMKLVAAELGKFFIATVG
jgi:hypothetical protein